MKPRFESHYDQFVRNFDITGVGKVPENNTTGWPKLSECNWVGKTILRPSMDGLAWGHNSLQPTVWAYVIVKNVDTR